MVRKLFTVISVIIVYIIVGMLEVHADMGAVIEIPISLVSDKNTSVEYFVRGIEGDEPLPEGSSGEYIFSLSGSEDIMLPIEFKEEGIYKYRVSCSENYTWSIDIYVYQSGYNVVILNEDGKKVDGINLSLDSESSESIESVENMPKTGDNSLIGSYMGILVVAVAVGVVALRRIRCE